jgi:hypothetical protein
MPPLFETMAILGGDASLIRQAEAKLESPEN